MLLNLRVLLVWWYYNDIWMRTMIFDYEDKLTWNIYDNLKFYKYQLNNRNFTVEKNGREKLISSRGCVLKTWISSRKKKFKKGDSFWGRKYGIILYKYNVIRKQLIPRSHNQQHWFFKQIMMLFIYFHYIVVMKKLSFVSLTIDYLVIFN